MTLQTRKTFPFLMFALLLGLDVGVFLVDKLASRATSGDGFVFIGHLALQPWVGCILLLKVGQLLTWTSILRRVDVSLAFPLTSLSYPAAMLAAMLLFRESLSWHVWAGGLLITAGAIVMGPGMQEDELHQGLIDGGSHGEPPMDAQDTNPSSPQSPEKVSNLTLLPQGKRVIFAYSYWDIMPVLAAILHAGYIAALFFAFRYWPIWAMLPLGLIYSISISWNINGISHNFIHNPYFKSPVLNRLFSFLLSLVNAFSQVFYDCVHRRHHVGNSDKQDEQGQTIDWLSIYRHGHDGQAENVWAYVFLSYFRDDIAETYREIKRSDPREARWGIAEICCTVTMVLVGFWLNWRFMLFMIPFYYLGHSLSSLNGYYKHFGGNPDEPIAWGVSSYGWLYNLIWFNNGFHAEHHFRPSVHWTRMARLQQQIAEKQKAAGVRVIVPPHALGFLDPGLKQLQQEARPVPSETHA